MRCPELEPSGFDFLVILAVVGDIESVGRYRVCFAEDELSFLLGIYHNINRRRRECVLLLHRHVLCWQCILSGDEL